MSRSLLASALYCLVLAACVRLPATTRPALPDEQAAILATIAAFESARGPVSCVALDRVDVAALPLDELHAWCQSDTADACVSVVQRYPLAPPSTFLRVRSDVDALQRLRFVQHEAGHVIRACWVAGDFARFGTGASEACAIQWPSDPWHCDHDLWDAILADAWQRYTGD